MADRRVLQCGDVCYINFRGCHSVQSGWRPGIVLQNQSANTFSPNVIVVPLTSAIKREDMPTHVVLPATATGLPCDSMALCETPQCVSKEDVGGHINALSRKYMREIAIASLVATSVLTYLDRESIAEARRLTRAANEVDV